MWKGPLTFNFKQVLFDFSSTTQNSLKRKNNKTHFFAGICLIKSHCKQRTEQLNKIKIYHVTQK